MSHSVLSFAGKSVVVVAGVVYGLRHGLGQPTGSRPVAERADRGCGSTSRIPLEYAVGDILDRLDRVEKTLGRVNESERPAAAAAVSREDLNEGLARSRSQILSEVDERFEAHRLSIGTLHSLIAQNQEMLERVMKQLEHIPEAGDSDEAEGSGN